MSYVYVAESGAGYCKIGKSNDPESRVKQIECDTWLAITRLDYFECTGCPYETEKLCHESAMQWSLFGEWFAIDFETACEIVKNCIPAAPPKIASNEDRKLVSQWKATEEQYQHLADMAEKENTSIVGYLKQLINEDMRNNK